MTTRDGANCTKKALKLLRLSRNRSVIFHSSLAIASSKTFFARSTATVVECIWWTPFGEGFSCERKLSLAHRCRTAIQEESISSLVGSVNGFCGRAADAGKTLCASQRLIGRLWAAPRFHL